MTSYQGEMVAICAQKETIHDLHFILKGRLKLLTWTGHEYSMT